MKTANMNTTWASSGLVEDVDQDGDVDLKDVAISLAFFGGVIVTVFIKVFAAMLQDRLMGSSSGSRSNSNQSE